MKKVFSMWRGIFAVVSACVWLSAATVQGDQPFVVGWGMDDDKQVVPTDATVVCGGVSRIAAGHYHSLAVVDSRTYAWGDNGAGQCNVPSAGRTNVVEVAAGKEFSVALRTDHTVVGWGWNSTNSVNRLIGDITNHVAQMSAGALHVLVLKENGQVEAVGFDSASSERPEYKVPEDLSGVDQIAAGTYFNLVRKGDGTIRAWGSEDDEATREVIDGIPASLQGHAKSIAAGHYHALAINDQGGVVEWGWINGHDMPDGVRTGVVAIAAGYDFSMALTSDGVVHVWGNADYGQQEFPPSLEAGVSRISAGFGHCLAAGEGMAPRWLAANVPGEAYVDRPYAGNVTATGSPSVVYAKGGTWPTWLDLKADGSLSGTPRKTGVFTNILVLASNVYGVTSNTFRVAVSDTPLDPPGFITTTVPNGEVGKPYDFKILASNEPVFYLSQAASYPLPAGLTLLADGTLCGIPSKEYASTFFVTVSNATAAATTNFTMSVIPPTAAPVILTGSPLPDATLGTPYSVTNKTDRVATFALAGGTLPPGLGLEPATGVISGTPTAASNYVFSIQAANSEGASTSEFELAVNAAPAISTTSLPGGSLDRDYSQRIEAPGWPAPTFDLVSGSLPGGLSLDAASGLISGKPTDSGNFSFVVSASNALGSDTQDFTIAIDSAQLPRFTSISFSNRNVRLEWTAPQATNTYYIDWSTNIAGTNANWKSFVSKPQKSPWTDTKSKTNAAPIYYRLRAP